MSFLFENNAVSTLASGITAGALSLTVQSGDGALFPNPTGGDTFRVTLVDAANLIEIVDCTGRSGDVLTIVRAQEGTSAKVYISGDSVGLRLTKETVADFSQKVDTVLKAVEAIKSLGNLTFNDNIQLDFGTGDDVEIYHDGTDLLIDGNNASKIKIRDGDSGNAERFLFDIQNGFFSALGGTPLDTELYQWVTANNRYEPANPMLGSVIPFAQVSAPTGWLVCDGTAVSRSVYAALYAAIATVYGVGNGSTTFNLPDLRGEFVRGFDDGAGNDPDAATRTDSGGGITGDNIGTKQAGDVGAHDHKIELATLPRSLDWARPAGGGTSFEPQYEGNLSTTRDGLTNENTGTNETRPRNVAMLYCIKY